MKNRMSGTNGLGAFLELTLGEPALREVGAQGLNRFLALGIEHRSGAQVGNPGREGEIIEDDLHTSPPPSVRSRGGLRAVTCVVILADPGTAGTMDGPSVGSPPQLGRVR